MSTTTTLPGQAETLEVEVRKSPFVASTASASIRFEEVKKLLCSRPLTRPKRVKPRD